MIDPHVFLKQAELELRNSKSLSASLCQTWDALPDEARTAFAQAMAFVGCPQATRVGTTTATTSEADRVGAARLMLLKLGLDGNDPRWSSSVVDRLLRDLMQIPGGAVGDLFFALCGVLGDYSTELSKPVAALIKELVVRCFTRFRESYESVDWVRLIQGFGSQATKAQLYLTLHAVPPQFVSPQLAGTIARELESTAFREEAESALAG
jgi:hypothetical protein